MDTGAEAKSFDEGVLYRCGACNYKFPGEMARSDGDALQCPACKTAIVEFASYEDGSTFEFIAHTQADRFGFQGDQD